MSLLHEYIGHTIYIYTCNKKDVGLRRIVGVLVDSDYRNVKVITAERTEYVNIPKRIKAGEPFNSYVWYPEPSLLPALKALAESKTEKAKTLTKMAEKLRTEAKTLRDSADLFSELIKGEANE